MELYLSSFMVFLIFLSFNCNTVSCLHGVKNNRNPVIITSSNASNLPAVFAFGDSLLDNGNNNYILTLVKANFLPYGIDYFHVPTGRFSNGRNVGDIVVQGLGFAELPPPYLAPTTTGNATLRGVNYASAFSGILEETGNFLYGLLDNITIGPVTVNLSNLSTIGRVPLQQQIIFFAETKSQLVDMLGESEANNLIANSLFMISSGSDDYIDNYLFPFSFDRFYYDPTDFSNHLVDTLRNHLTTLYNMGARKIMVAGIGPIGCTPFIRSINVLMSGGGGCSSYANNLVSGFNAQAAKMINQLNRDIHDLIVVHADTFNSIYDIVANPLKYGFTNSEVACCGLGGRYRGIISCLPSMDYCDRRWETVFWDAYHPTEAAGIVIANEFLNGDRSRIYPMNLRQLANLSLIP